MMMHNAVENSNCLPTIDQLFILQWSLIKGKCILCYKLQTFHYYLYLYVVAIKIVLRLIIGSWIVGKNKYTPGQIELDSVST